MNSIAAEPLSLRGMTSCELCGANKTSQALFTTMTELTVNGKTEYIYLQGVS